MRLALAVLPLFALLLNGSAEEIPAPVINLTRIFRRMAEELKRLPNYTCMETISRYTAVQGGKRDPLDRIRINVAVIEGKELYSWPGAKSFEDRSLGEMVNNGFISDGDFSAMTRNVFVNRNAVVTFAGEEALEGRALLRYNFVISQIRSGWQVGHRGVSGVVGAKGWFLADAATWDLVRFSFAAVDLPPFSGDKRLEEDIEYGRVPLGGADILLPQTVDLESESFNGDVHWNHATFDGCRQYGADTSISFGAESAAGENTPAEAALRSVKAEDEKSQRALPAGVEIQLRLESPVDSAHTAVGDEIRAVVAKDVRIDKGVVLPRGAVVTGVIRRFDRHVGNVPYSTVGIEFTEAALESQRVFVFGTLQDISRFPGLHRNVVSFDGANELPRTSGVGYFFVAGDAFVIPQGVSLVWRTQTLRMR